MAVFLPGTYEDIKRVAKKQAELRMRMTELEGTAAERTLNLRGSDDRFQLLIDQAGDAFFILDYEGTIRDVNRRACLSLGYSREELLGLSISEVDVDVDPKQHIQEFWDPLEAGKHVTFEGKHRRKDGSSFPVEVRLGRLDLATEKLLLALARDITERKHNERELERHREFERLVAKISMKIAGQTGLELENSIKSSLVMYANSSTWMLSGFTDCLQTEMF